MYLKGVTQHNHEHLLDNRHIIAQQDKEAFLKLGDEEEEEEEKPDADEDDDGTVSRCGSSNSFRQDEGDGSRPVTPDLTGEDKVFGKSA